ncbi:MAG: hypothetical protein LBJ74_05955 [Heliobacteriaceae bacterium]|jgi:hypothetical protein|nr:hypothetical protein [Heliobacteriaceae bacterium]
MIDYLLEKLNLDESRRPSIEAFSEAHRLKPYVKILENSPDIINKLKRISPEIIKDSWDCIVELYRYNIKLSKAVYPYLAILENILKIKITNYLKNKYGKDYYYNKDIIFEALDLDKFDKEMFEQYLHHKINRVIYVDLVEKYKETNPELSKDKIKSKIIKIKWAISILSDADEYCFKNNYPNLEGFIETKPTLNYWITLLEIRKFFAKDDESLDLKEIFPAIKNEDIKTLKTIVQKLDDIRMLRNYISHYNRIICTKISKHLTLRDIYENIIEIFNLLGCQDVNYIVGDITCCGQSDFEALYSKLDFVHEIIC